MPLYEYECANGHRVEVIQKFSDPPLQTCATCGAPVHKLQASPAFQFKGSGWYITDYAKKDSGGKGEAAKDAKDTKDTKDASTDKSETTSKSESSESTTKTETPASSSPAKP
jgi:putative FmdB family regulatory protein